MDEYTIPHTATPLYGKSGRLVHGKTDMPLYGFFSKELWIMTEWRFDDPHVDTVDVYINGVMVCMYHDTSHIIDYNLGKLGSDTIWDGGMQCWVVPFTMGIKYHSTSSVPPVPVVFRCWVEDYKDDTSVQTDGYVGDEKDFYFKIYPQEQGARRYSLVAGKYEPDEPEPEPEEQQ